MNCINPFPLYFNPNKSYKSLLANLKYKGQFVEVPCGKCLPCRIQKSREWAMRMLHEYDKWDDAVFLTLTYDDDHLPYVDNPLRPGIRSDRSITLKVEELQLYFKRVRKALGKRKIRYYACGEYGTENKRPHYHAIVYGVSILEHKLDRGKLLGGVLYDCWQNKGFAYLGDVQYDSCAYVAGYIEGKYDDETNESVYTNTGRIPPFKLSSNGLGKEFALQHSEQLKENLLCKVRGKDCSLPRYYRKILGINSEQTRDVFLTYEADVLYDYYSMGICDINTIRNLRRKARIQNYKMLEASLRMKRNNKRL